MEGFFKQQMEGKSNVFDRYAYFAIQVFRYQMALGLRINSVAEKYTKDGLNACLEKLEELKAEIKSLPDKDREFLIKDANFCNFGSGCYNDLNDKMIELGKSLQTEFTQTKPKISEDLLKWFYMELN